jgi:hypothetical protein
VGNTLDFLGLVTYLGRDITFACTDSGAFTIPDPTPLCRLPIDCGDPPMPPNTTRLQDSWSTDVKEYTSTFYDCQQGSKIPDAVTDNIVDGNFSVACLAGGKYEVVL